MDLPPNDSTVAPLRDLPHMLCEGVASFPASAVTQLGNRQIPGVAHPDDLDREVRKDAEQVVPPLPGAVVPSIGLPLDREHTRDPDDVRMGQREKGVEVAPVERLYAPPVKLNVLFRHRPPSISRAVRPGRSSEAAARRTTHPWDTGRDGQSPAPLVDRRVQVA